MSLQYEPSSLHQEFRGVPLLVDGSALSCATLDTTPDLRRACAPGEGSAVSGRFSEVNPTPSVLSRLGLMFLHPKP